MIDRIFQRKKVLYLHRWPPAASEPAHPRGQQLKISGKNLPAFYEDAVVKKNSGLRLAHYKLPGTKKNYCLRKHCAPDFSWAAVEVEMYFCDGCKEIFLGD